MTTPAKPLPCPRHGCELEQFNVHDAFRCPECAKNSGWMSLAESNRRSSPDAEVVAAADDQPYRLKYEGAERMLSQAMTELRVVRECLDDATKTLRFCKKWGGRSGRIPDPQPGSKLDHAKKCLERIKAALSAAPAKAEVRAGTELSESEHDALNPGPFASDDSASEQKRKVLAACVRRLLAAAQGGGE